MKKEKQFTSAEPYTAPNIEIIDIELSQNIFNGSNGGDEDIYSF